MNDEQKIISLEIKVAHQEVLLEELNSVVYQQQRSIDQCEAKISVLIKKMKEFGGSGGIEIGPANEKPPHY